MESSQQTLRVANLPSKTQTSDVERFFDSRIDRRHGRRVVESVGPICQHASRVQKRTTVSFSSHNTAKKALALEETSRELIAEHGGRETFTLDSSFKDLTTLHSSNNPNTGKPDIDIVALHGLTGHAWNSFTTTSVVNQEAGRTKETNWLRDIMPRLLEQNQQQQIYPRIMTYGYNADVWMTKSVAEIDVPVGNLLSYLASERSTDPDRPLFFIGHSLGGIVCQQTIVELANQAVIQSSQRPTSSNEPYNFPVKGCMFFGVPNKGSDVADSANTILKLLNTVFNVNRNVVEDLQSKSHKLADFAAQFRQIRYENNIPVISFYEQQRYNSSLGLIVNRDSAVIEYPGSPQPFGVDRNHKEMVKFSDSDAHALEPAMYFLAQFAHNAIAAQHRQRTIAPLPPPSAPNNPNVEDKFSVLRFYDTVFLVDDSPSMGSGGRWDLVKKILDYSTAVATTYDPDGIDVHFFNNRSANQDNVRDRAVAVEIHQNISLQGNTPIRDQLSKHLKNYMRKYKKRPEDDLNYKGYNLIVLTDGEPNPEWEDANDISDIEDARVTKPAYRMIRKLLVKIAKELDEEDAERGQIGVQFCQIGNLSEARTFFNFLDNRLRGKWKLDRDMVDTVACESEADLTMKFFEKLLLGAIDKAVDHDEIPTAGAAETATIGHYEPQYSPPIPHRPKEATHEYYIPSWPAGEKRDSASSGHRYSDSNAPQIRPHRDSRSFAVLPVDRPPRFDPGPDSFTEPFHPALPRHTTIPHGVVELPFQQTPRSSTGDHEPPSKWWRPRR